MIRALREADDLTIRLNLVDIAKVHEVFCPQGRKQAGTCGVPGLGYNRLQIRYGGA